MQVEQETMTSGSVVPMVAIISNPKSTTNSECMADLRSLIEQTKNVVHFELGGIGDIDEALSLFARANPAVLIINGGDGTIGAVLSALLYRNPFKVTPPIAYLPGGKTNMTAADLGYRGKPHKVLRKILECVHGGKIVDQIVRRQLIELDMGDDTGRKVGTFFGSAGVVKGIRWTQKKAYAAGVPNSLAHVMAAIKLTLSAFGLGKDRDIMMSDPMEIVIKGGGRLNGQYSYAVATTLDKLLLGTKPYGQEGAGGLRFSAVEVGGPNFVRALWGLIIRTYGKKSIRGVHVRRSDEIRVLTSNPVTLDGEIYTPTPDAPITLRGDRSLVFLKLK